MQNYIRKKIKTNNLVIGTWITIPSVELIDIFSSMGFDFLVFDNEHSPIDANLAYKMSLVAKKNNVASIIRLSENRPDLIQKFSDLGFDGIKVPSIKNFTDAEKFINSALYSPLGSKGLSPFTPTAHYNQVEVGKFINDYNKNIFLIAQIEGKDALEKLDEIIKIQRIDLFFIGMFDLSLSLGIPGEFKNQLFVKSFRKVIDLCKKNNFIVGSIANNDDEMRFLIDNGVKYITYSADCALIANKIKDVVQKYKF